MRHPNRCLVAHGTQSTARNASYLFEPRPHSSTGSHPDRVCSYATGYGTAYSSYQDLSRRYIAQLNRPRIRLPAIVGFVGAVGAVGVGLVVGRVIP
jgi:hypothetical protein